VHDIRKIGKNSPSKGALAVIFTVLCPCTINPPYIPGKAICMHRYSADAFVFSEMKSID
jgi:hypothetical protein